MACLLCGKAVGVSVKKDFEICQGCFDDQQRLEKSTVRACLKFEEPSEVADGVFVGGECSTLDDDWLQRHNIQRVLCVAAFCTPKYDPRLKVMVVAIDDSPEEDLVSHLPQALEFIDEALRHRSAILVHCISGISRSGAVAIAHVMKTRSLSFEQAWKLVGQRRPCIHPNSGFQAQLNTWNPSS